LLEHNFQAATLHIQTISACQQDLAEKRKRYHGDMMVLQGQHSRLVALREQSIKLADMYSKTDNMEKVTSYLDNVENLGNDIKNIREQMNNALENQNNNKQDRDKKYLQLQQLCNSWITRQPQGRFLVCVQDPHKILLVDYLLVQVQKPSQQQKISLTTLLQMIQQLQHIHKMATHSTP
jgi:hypothetical protein